VAASMSETEIWTVWTLIVAASMSETEEECECVSMWRTNVEQ